MPAIRDLVAMLHWAMISPTASAPARLGAASFSTPPQEGYASEPEAWFIRRGTHMVRPGRNAFAACSAYAESMPARCPPPRVCLAHTHPPVAAGSWCTQAPAAIWLTVLPGRASGAQAGCLDALRLQAGQSSSLSRSSCPPSQQALEVEEFEEAERALRRHGVEYSRHVLPGDSCPRAGTPGLYAPPACSACWPRVLLPGKEASMMTAAEREHGEQHFSRRPGSTILVASGPTSLP